MEPQNWRADHDDEDDEDDPGDAYGDENADAEERDAIANGPGVGVDRREW